MAERDVKKRGKGGEPKRSCREEALFWLEYGDRTEREMARRLQQKGYDERQVAETMAFLLEFSFLDDRRYAVKFVESAMERGRGPLRIRHELGEKGIPGELTEQALEQLYDGDAQREIALSVAEKALRSIGGAYEDGANGADVEDETGEDEKVRRLSEKDKAKIARRLAAAGFSAGAAYDAIRRLK